MNTIYTDTHTSAIIVVVVVVAPFDAFIALFSTPKPMSWESHHTSYHPLLPP